MRAGVSVRGAAGWLLANLAVALAYASSAPLIFAFGLPPSYVSPVYPPSGVAVASFLILGPRVLPGVWLGNTLSSAVLLTEGPDSVAALLVAVLGGLGATIEPLVAGWAMGRFAGGATHPFDRPRHVVVFLAGGALLAGAVGGAVGVLEAWLTGLVPTSAIGTTAATWLLGDAAGIAIFAPLILAWHHGGVPPAGRRAGLAVAAASIAAVVLGVATVEAASGIAIYYLHLPIVVWAGFRAGPRGATLAATLVSVVAVLSAVHGRGAFAGWALTDALLRLEGFIAVTIATALVVCATLARQELAEAALAEHAHTLERRVADRTAELVEKNRLLSEKQRRIDEELGAAHALQIGILPSSFAGVPGFEVAAAARPALEMSGDFYDVFEVAPGRRGLVVADVSGKGVAAAFLMAVTRTLVRGAAAGGLSPAARVAAVNEELCRENPLSMFVTLFYAELDEATGELACINAGHCPPVLLGAGGGATALRPAGDVALGVVEGFAYQERRLTLAPGEALFLYTDGVTEAFDAGGRAYGDERLLRTLAGQAGLAPEEVVRGVVASVEAFVAGAVQSDDITCLVVRREAAAR